MPAHVITSEQQRDRMLHTPIPRLILSLCLPTLATQLISVFYNTADTYFVSKLSTSASAAVGVVFSLMSIIQAFGFGIGMGCGSIISRSLGGKDNDRADRIGSSAFVFAAAVGLALCAAGLCTLRPLMRLLGSTDTILPYAESYARIILLAAPIMCASFVLSNVLRAEGEATLSMYGMCVGGLLNVGLDPLFIFAFHMGVRGAALATILSQGVSCVWVCAFLRGKKTLLRLKNENIRLRPKFFLPCIALGAASFIMQASESVISVCFNTSLLKYGGDIAVGAMTILTSVMQFAMLPLQGLAQGAQPILSYNYGAKNAGRVRKAFQLLLISSLVYSTLLWSAIQIFPSVFASIFTPNEELIVFAAKALRIYCGVLVLFGIQIACQMTFVSLGNAPCSIIVAVVRKFVLLIPLIYIMPQLVSDQAMGVYMAEPVADVIAVTFTAILFSRQFRKSMTALELEAKNSDA